MDYEEYLQTETWAKKRKERMTTDCYKCTQCGSTDNLQVHHKTYERLGYERMDDLSTMCKECHFKIHDDSFSIKQLLSELREIRNKHQLGMIGEFQKAGNKYAINYRDNLFGNPNMTRCNEYKAFRLMLAEYIKQNSDLIIDPTEWCESSFTTWAEVARAVSDKQTNQIMKLKNNGFSLNEISRITGIKPTRICTKVSKRKTT